MTNMKRITIAFPEEVDNAILALRANKEFARCSYSEIVRRLINTALDHEKSETNQRDRPA